MKGADDVDAREHDYEDEDNEQPDGIHVFILSGAPASAGKWNIQRNRQQTPQRYSPHELTARMGRSWKYLARDYCPFFRDFRGTKMIPATRTSPTPTPTPMAKSMMHLLVANGLAMQATRCSEESDVSRNLEVADDCGFPEAERCAGIGSAALRG